jgi:hypothetical protein
VTSGSHCAPRRPDGEFRRVRPARCRTPNTPGSSSVEDHRVEHDLEPPPPVDDLLLHPYSTTHCGSWPPPGDHHPSVRGLIRASRPPGRTRTSALCSQFPDEYWRETDLNRRYPQEFVDTLTAAGLLSALIPTEYGGLGASLTQASVIMKEINKSGGHSAACHAQM